jgi:hypothetical protein
MVTETIPGHALRGANLPTVSLDLEVLSKQTTHFYWQAVQMRFYEDQSASWMFSWSIPIDVEPFRNGGKHHNFIPTRVAHETQLHLVGEYVCFRICFRMQWLFYRMISVDHK